MTDQSVPKETEAAVAPVAQEPAECLRCRLPKMLDDDGFCEICAAEIEKACL